MNTHIQNCAYKATHSLCGAVIEEYFGLASNGPISLKKV